MKKEILNFLNKEHKPFKERGDWYDNFKNNVKESNQAIHWGNIGKFLEKYQIIMIDHNHDIYDFTEDIKFRDGEEIRMKAERVKEWDWLPREFKAYEMLGKADDRPTYNDHVCGIIGLLHSFGYTFKDKDDIQENIDSYNSVDTSSTTKNEKMTIAELKQKKRLENN